MTTKMLEAIFKNVDSQLLTEDVKKEVEDLLTEAIDAKVEAKTVEIKEAYEAKEVELKESFEAKEVELKEQTEANERVLVEEAQKYKKDLEQAVIEETKSFKDRVEAELAEESTKYRTEVEAMVLEEAKELKARQDAALVEEVKKFRDEMIDKVSDYIEAQLQESIPTELMEAAAKLEVYEPLVESVQSAFASNFIKLDTTSYKLIKEARDEIEALKSEVQNKTKDQITLKKEMKNVKRNMKVESITEGLTAKQKSRAIKLLEGVDYDDLEGRFEKIRDVIIESDAPAAPQKRVAQSKKAQKLQESKKQEPKQKETKKDEQEDEVIKHQVKQVIKESEAKEKLLNESKKVPTVPNGANPNISAWQAKLDKQRNRS